MKAPKCRLCGEHHWSREQCAARPKSRGVVVASPERRSDTAPQPKPIAVNGARTPRESMQVRKRTKRGVATRVDKPADAESVAGTAREAPAQIHRPAASKSRKGVKRLGSRGPAPGTGGRPKKGTEKQTIAHRKPWEAQGISERTWWRHQAAKRAT